MANSIVFTSSHAAKSPYEFNIFVPTGNKRLTTRFERHRRRHLFAVANELDRYDVADLAVSQSIGKVVEIIDRLVAKSDQDVPGL